MPEQVQLIKLDTGQAACALALPGGVLALAVREMFNRARVEQLYSIEDAAHILGKSVRTVWSLVEDRSIAPFYFVGRERRIPESAIQRYLDSRVV